MKEFIMGFTAAGALAGVIGTLVVLSGGISVAADEPHHPAVFAVLDFARERAIEHSSTGVTVPGDLDDNERIRRGAGNYAAMCADCHLSPDVETSEIRSGLYPAPPDLTDAAVHDETSGGHSHGNIDAERFWVIKHGIKASGMPAWGKGGMTDENIWDLVAFAKALPSMGLAEYRAWVSTSDGHSHGSDSMDSSAHEHGAAEPAHSGATDAGHHTGEAVHDPAPDNGSEMATLSAPEHGHSEGSDHSH
jgi:mono/diheme cytochrome c family protein